MSVREQLLREIETAPESVLGEVIDFVQFLKQKSATPPHDPRTVEERLAALRKWVGHLDVPFFPADYVLDRGELYRDVQ